MRTTLKIFDSDTRLFHQVSQSTRKRVRHSIKNLCHSCELLFPSEFAFVFGKCEVVPIVFFVAVQRSKTIFCYTTLFINMDEAKTALVYVRISPRCQTNP